MPQHCENFGSDSLQRRRYEWGKDFRAARSKCFILTTTRAVTLPEAALDRQVRILPDLPYPPAKGIETILQELSRTYPEASKLTPESIIDASIVKDASS